MKYSFTLISLCLLFSGCQKQENLPFTTIFNGKDLTNWKGQEGVWKVKNGVLHTSNAQKRTWLIWEGGTTKDFELKMKVKFTAGNSGVQIRSHEIEPYLVRGYQMEVAAQEKMGLWHHSLLEKKDKHRSLLSLAGQTVLIDKAGKKTVKQTKDAAQVQKAWTDREWNDITIIAKGPRITQYVNGVLLSDLTDLEVGMSMSEGILALQNHGKGTVAEFKDIRIRNF